MGAEHAADKVRRRIIRNTRPKGVPHPGKLYCKALTVHFSNERLWKQGLMKKLKPLLIAFCWHFSAPDG
jgi:hypothetical protein